eukprot:scaffold209810_cov28-Tisochrysis_lutea.AAC.4
MAHARALQASKVGSTSVAPLHALAELSGGRTIGASMCTGANTRSSEAVNTCIDVEAGPGPRVTYARTETE